MAWRAICPAALCHRLLDRQRGLGYSSPQRNTAIRSSGIEEPDESGSGAGPLIWAYLFGLHLSYGACSVYSVANPRVSGWRVIQSFPTKKRPPSIYATGWGGGGSSGGNFNITTGADIVQVAAWVLLAFGLLLLAYSFFVRSSAAKSENAGGRTQSGHARCSRCAERGVSPAAKAAPADCAARLDVEQAQKPLDQ